MESVRSRLLAQLSTEANASLSAMVEHRIPAVGAGEDGSCRCIPAWLGTHDADERPQRHTERWLSRKSEFIPDPRRSVIQVVGVSALLKK
jgi:hypothetical protein